MRRTRDQILSNDRDAGRIARVSAQYDAQCHRIAATQLGEVSRQVIEVPCEFAPGVRRRTVCSISPQ